MMGFELFMVWLQLHFLFHHPLHPHIPPVSRCLKLPSWKYIGRHILSINWCWMLMMHRCGSVCKKCRDQTAHPRSPRHLCSCWGETLVSYKKGYGGTWVLDAGGESPKSKHMVSYASCSLYSFWTSFLCSCCSPGLRSFAYRIHLISRQWMLLQASQKLFAGKVLSKSSSNPEVWIFFSGFFFFFFGFYWFFIFIFLLVGG